MNDAQQSDLLDEALGCISALRTDGAHIQSITNTVAQHFTANVLLACGASVSMTANAEELPGFMSVARALHINLGTLSNDRMAAIRLAVDMAHGKGLPIILDPVMIPLSPMRAEFAAEILPKATIVRGNVAEMDCLNASGAQVGGAKDICLVRTGKTDVIRMGDRRLAIENGSPAMGGIIATGCALGALICALASKTEDPFIAGFAGLAWFSIAGELAARTVTDPGSFQVALLDTLHTVSVEQLASEVRFA